MQTEKKLISLTCLLITCSQAYAGIFGASNYEDCVLEKLKDAKTDLAVQTVYAMCEGKFPSQKNNKSHDGIPPVCLLYWNGLNASKLQKEPTDWRNKYAKYKVDRFNMTVAYLFVPKEFELNKESESQMYRQVQIYCQ
jgi:hypothetical protein